MNKLYQDLCTLLDDFDKDREHVNNNTDLLMGYADDFYEMLNRVKDKFDYVLYDE